MTTDKDPAGPQDDDATQLITQTQDMAMDVDDEPAVDEGVVKGDGDAESHSRTKRQSSTEQAEAAPNPTDPSPTKKVKLEPPHPSSSSSSDDENFIDDGDDDDLMDIEVEAIASQAEAAAAMMKSEPIARRPPPPAQPSASTNGEMAQFQSWLHIFYQRLFPFTDFYRWLAYGEMSKGYFANREWSFTLASDVYIRFQSYKTADELKSEILRLCPVKIDIGAVYNIAPKDKKTVGPSAFRPRERELVFDIDMTDYDDIRTCCSGAEICLKCWDFMTISIKILHRALTEDFGFKHLLWVYSGRRGVHCWVADERARSMSPEARSAVVAYLEVVKGGYHQRGQGDEDPMDERNFHPSLVRAYAVLKKHFAKTILLNMDVLGSREHWMKLLQLVPDHEMRTRLDKEWTDETPDSDSGTTSEERWNRIVGELRGKKGAAFETADRAIIFRYTYPRLDANVSIGLNHLLKAPFCVHPKTGRVCVPIDPTQCDTFNPLTVPTIQSLLDELNAWSAKNNNPSYIEAESRRKIPDYQKTSLEPYVKYFRQGFLDPMASEVRQRMRERVDMSF